MEVFKLYTTHFPRNWLKPQTPMCGLSKHLQIHARALSIETHCSTITWWAAYLIGFQ